MKKMKKFSGNEAFKKPLKNIDRVTDSIKVKNNICWECNSELEKNSTRGLCNDCEQKLNSGSSERECDNCAKRIKAEEYNENNGLCVPCARSI